MSAATINQTSERAPGTDLSRGIGLHGRVAVTWSAAGGILLGGILVALMTLTGRLSGHGLFFTSSGLFVIGAVLGMIHGGTLGYFGRSAQVEPRQALGELGRSVLYAIPALAVSWLVTVWIAMTLAATYLDRTFTMMGVAAAWAVGIVAVAAAGVYGWRGFRNAYARWPQRRVGTVLVATSFAALLVLFLADRPHVWGLQLRVTETGAVVLAAFLALWVAGPAITLALRLLQDLPVPQPRLAFGKGDGRMSWADAGVGLLAGGILGVLAVPFIGVASPGLGGTLVAAVSQAVVDEVLLRLVLLTGVVWVLLRWHRVHAQEAAVAAVAVTALVQIALYAPGVAAVGFPTTLGALGFALVTVALPALVFGVLYWKRGFGTALLADATAVVAMVLLAI